MKKGRQHFLRTFYVLRTIHILPFFKARLYRRYYRGLMRAQSSGSHGRAQSLALQFGHGERIVFGVRLKFRSCRLPLLTWANC